jgi:mannose-6-phosphate isomerase-like protein (cupin superfamily)
MELAAPARLAFAVHEHFFFIEKVARLAAGVDQIRELEELPKADHVAPDLDLALFRHLWSVAAASVGRAMTDYTIKNLKDLDDLAAGRTEGVEARMARSALDAEQVGVSYFRYGPNVRTPTGHHHKVQEEAYVVISGSGRLKLDDEVIDVKQWDVIRVAPAVVRGFEGGPDGIEVIAVGGPRPEEGDGEMVAGWWDN